MRHSASMSYKKHSTLEESMILKLIIQISNLITYFKLLSSCRRVSNIRHILVGNKIVDHSDVVGASPVGAAPTTSSFST